MVQEWRCGLARGETVAGGWEERERVSVGWEAGGGGEVGVVTRGQADSPEELGGPLHHLQPHGRHSPLVKQGGLGKGAQGVQRLLQELAAQVGVVSCGSQRGSGALTPSYMTRRVTRREPRYANLVGLG